MTRALDVPDPHRARRSQARRSACPGSSSTAAKAGIRLRPSRIRERNSSSRSRTGFSTRFVPSSPPLAFGPWQAAQWVANRASPRAGSPRGGRGGALAIEPGDLLGRDPLRGRGGLGARVGLGQVVDQRLLAVGGQRRAPARPSSRPRRSTAWSSAAGGWSCPRRGTSGSSRRTTGGPPRGRPGAPRRPPAGPGRSTRGGRPARPRGPGRRASGAANGEGSWSITGLSMG